MGHTCPYMAHICPYMAHIWPSMAVYGPCNRICVKDVMRCFRGVATVAGGKSMQELNAHDFQDFSAELPLGGTWGVDEQSIEHWATMAIYGHI